MVEVRNKTRTMSAVFPLLIATAALAGDLTPPPGPVAPTPGPEARIPISAATTPGDADSVFRLSTGGSYYLTGDIQGVAGKHGVEIDASDITLDLNGFSIKGAPGTLDGVHVSSQRFAITIRNGRVFSFGGDGIDGETAFRSRLVGVTSTNNSGRGIVMDDRAHITDCVADTNGGGGIVAHADSLVSECTATGNTGIGIHVVNAHSRVQHCVSVANTGIGILLSFGGVVEQSTASFNGDAGILASDNCHVIECTANSNTLSGIFVQSSSLVLRNSCNSNGSAVPSVDAGITVSGSTGGTRVEGNNCTKNDIGIAVLQGGNLIIGNSASGNSISGYSFVGPQIAGPIVTNLTPIATASAWSNFQF